MRTRMFCALLSIIALGVYAIDDSNHDGIRKKINLSEVKCPKPARMIDEPVAEYNTVTGTLTITLDAVSYSEYTIILSSGYANVDYYPTSSVVMFPATALSEITYIYIDSDDCGTYEGVLDMNAIGSNTY